MIVSIEKLYKKKEWEICTSYTEGRTNINMFPCKTKWTRHNPAPQMARPKGNNVV